MPDTKMLPFAEPGPQPVDCLGRWFESEDARRAWFLERLKEYLADSAFRARPGFPQADDDTILRLSDPPYYTACPNPFLEEFVRRHGRAYDPEEPYEVAPYTADVTEGKTDPLYKAHNYHTKVPHKAIVPFILAYTKPGDIVLDGFAGSGMTGVAAAWCGTAPADQRRAIGARFATQGRSAPEWGARHAILADLSPAATFIAANTTIPVDVETFAAKAKRILDEVEEELGWMYRTRHVVNGKPTGTYGRIAYTVWSQAFTCPDCTGEIVFTDVALDEDTKRVHEAFKCPHCGAALTKDSMRPVMVSEIDPVTEEQRDRIKFMPYAIHYTIGRAKHVKAPDAEDLDVLKRVEAMPLPPTVPTNRLPIERMYHGSRLAPKGVTHIHHFFLPRAAQALGALWSRAQAENDLRLRNMLLYFVEQAIWGMSLLNRYTPTHYSHVNQYLTGVYYIAAQHAEPVSSYILSGKLGNLIRVFSKAWPDSTSYVSCASTSSLGISDSSVDYIFTDPPFGENIFYADLNLLVESWHGVVTDSVAEAIVDTPKEKDIDAYRDAMAACFAEYHRVLKPGRWITVVFHNSYNAVWNAIQEAMARAGFVVASVLTLDKKHLSYRQETSATVKNDLVINAYKPAPEMVARFKAAAGTADSVWTFIEEHLHRAPLMADLGGRRETTAERTPLRLYDRMVTFHLQNRQSVPLNRGEFVAELEARFPLVDGMHFLDEDQVRLYEGEKARRGTPEQAELFIGDERGAIRWLHRQLEEKPRRIDDLYNPYKSAAQTWPAKEQTIELKELLRQNFGHYEGDRPVPERLLAKLVEMRPELEGRGPDDRRVKSAANDLWYVPDPADQAEMERIREEALWAEFQRYREHTGRRRLPKARREAVRVGFNRLLGEGRFDVILDVAKHLPEETVQEDEQITLLYDTARALAGEI